MPKTNQVRMEFGYNGGGLGKGANVTLFCDGQPIGKGRIERTHLFAFALDETLEVGCDLGEPVSEDYGAAATSSPARSTGSRSTSTRRPRTSIT